MEACTELCWERLVRFASLQADRITRQRNPTEERDLVRSNVCNILQYMWMDVAMLLVHVRAYVECSSVQGRSSSQGVVSPP